MSEPTVDDPNKRLKHLLGKCWVFLGILIILMAIIFSVFRALTPWARQYKTTVETHLSTLLGQPVVIQSMETGWYWLHPVLQLNRISLTDDQEHTLKLKKLLVGINLFSSLLHWKLQPGILYIDQTKLIFRQVNNHWSLEGLNLTGQDTEFGPDTYLPIFAWLSTQQKIIFRQASVSVYFQDGSVVPLANVNVMLQNQGGRYRLKGSAQLARKIPTKLSMFADLELNPLAFNQTKGQIYLDVESVVPSQWQGFLPHLPMKVERGRGDATLWLELKSGQLVEAEGSLQFHHLILNREDRPELHKLPSVSMNFGWKRTKKGWDLSGSHLQLDMDGTKWPENSFFIHHNELLQENHIFAKHLLLTPLLAMELPWPEVFKPVLGMKPNGELYNTELNLKGHSPDYFLSGFTELGWNELGNIPAVSGLTGVVHWQPREGRFELDSHNTIITPHQLPPITFSRINTSMGWWSLNEGIRVSLENFLLQNQDLTLTAGGVLDDPEHFSSSHLRLVTQFSANHVEKWLKYIPSTALKKKLDHWLKQNIKQIAKASGQMTIDGNMADFPFDKAPGEFTILTYLTGTDLLIAPKWPLTRAIDAYLHVDGRNLNVDIQHANLNGIVIDNMNLRMDDIGLDYETLLLHGKINAAAEKMLPTVFKTPLGVKLSRLKVLDLRGLIGLDLKIEVPLYPENDEVLTQGEITFADNQILFHAGSSDLELDNLKGLIAFNETGVRDSKVNATLAGGPLSLHLESITHPKPATQVTIKGNTTMDGLRRSLNLPALVLMQGPLSLDGVLTLTDDPTDWDKLRLQSSLQGVTIDLPKPLGKIAGVAAPLIANIDFNAEKTMRLRINYDNRLTTDLLYNSSSKYITLDRGEIRIGNGEAAPQKEKGLKVSGKLALFDEKQWASVAEKFPSSESNTSLMSTIRWIDMTVDKIKIFHQQFVGVAIKAAQFDNKEWSLRINQKDISADVRYQQTTNTLSGQVNYFHLDKLTDSAPSPSHETEKLTPGDIPNLHLTIQKFTYGDVDVGQVILDSKSTQTNLQIESYKVISPSYEFNVKGNWLEANATSHTDVRADLTIKDLGKGLAQWHIKPVVEAHKGGVSFMGGWPGGVIDFSLSKVAGQIQIDIKNGRITDLGSATEEKLGLGKLLSIFSLQTIPRRLSLDFSDLSKNGYSFDQFKGNFQLKQGVMSTQDSEMDGPVAFVSMKGDLDVVKQLCFLDIFVSPHVMASLPVVATIAGGPVGPIAGIATWVAIKIINKSMLKVTGYTYKVSGPWMDPVVKQLDIYKKRVKP